MIEFILASGSPRRKELLEQMGITFRIEAAHGEEMMTRTAPSDIVEELSVQKAAEVADRMVAQGLQEKTVVIGADTIVAFQGQIMGKPKDGKDAMHMVAQLQNQVHQVFTGVTFMILDGTERISRTFYEKTDVTMYPMSEEEITAYVAAGGSVEDADNRQKPWYGKAGAYGIQDEFGMKYIKAIEGSYFNVVGLPVARLYQELKKAGITV